MNKEITTFEAALALSGTEKEKAFFAKTELTSAMEADEVAYKRLKVITRAINTDPISKETWEPNWNNSKEWKYFPWFEIKASKDKPAGFGFSYAGYAGWSADTNCGSRLCFKSSELAMYAGKQFEAIYNDFLNNQ